MKPIFLNSLFFLALLFSCNPLNREVEEPLPEIFLTSTFTDVSETQITIKGEISGARKISSDILGVVFSEIENPTIENAKVTTSNNNGKFDVKIQNLKPKKNYYFKAFVQTKDEVYYSNQLISSSNFENRWERKDDMSDKFKYFTGSMFRWESPNYLTVINTEEEQIGDIPIFVYNYAFVNGAIEPIKSWNVYTSIKVINGIKDMVSVSPSRDRTFVGGGYSINNSLPTSKVFSKKIWFVYDWSTFADIPFDGESVGMTVGNRIYWFQSKTNGEFYEITNLEWSKRKNAIFENLGRVAAAGTSQKGYLISESVNPKVKGGTLYEYNPNSDSWSVKKPFTGEERTDGVLFSVNEKIYYGLGRGKIKRQVLKDIWEYDPKTDDWKFTTYYPGNGNINLVLFTEKGIAYLGMGYQTNINNIEGIEFAGVRDIWTFKP